MFRKENGRVVVGDWRPFRAAIERAMQEEGIEKEVTINGDGGKTVSIPVQVWNIGCIAIDHWLDTHKKHCGDCKRELHDGEDIRCLDCKWLMCPTCAEKHFWPNGRPQGDHHGIGR